MPEVCYPKWKIKSHARNAAARLAPRAAGYISLRSVRRARAHLAPSVFLPFPYRTLGSVYPPINPPSTERGMDCSAGFVLPFFLPRSLVPSTGKLKTEHRRARILSFFFFFIFRFRRIVSVHRLPLLPSCRAQQFPKFIASKSSNSIEIVHRIVNQIAALYTRVNRTVSFIMTRKN